MASIIKGCSVRARLGNGLLPVQLAEPPSGEIAALAPSRGGYGVERAGFSAIADEERRRTAGRTATAGSVQRVCTNSPHAFSRQALCLLRLACRTASVASARQTFSSGALRRVRSVSLRSCCGAVPVRRVPSLPIPLLVPCNRDALHNSRGPLALVPRVSAGDWCSAERRAQLSRRVRAIDSEPGSGCDPRGRPGATHVWRRAACRRHGTPERCSLAFDSSR